MGRQSKAKKLRREEREFLSYSTPACGDYASSMLCAEMHLPIRRDWRTPLDGVPRHTTLTVISVDRESGTITYG